MGAPPHGLGPGASAAVPGGAPRPMLVATGISQHYGSHVALDNVDLEVAEGEFAALLGPSGCGKTTLLKLIGGLLDPTRGELRIAGRLMNSVAAHKRPVNTVFQNYALFPHMRVFENVAFGPRRQRRPEAEINESVRSALHLVGMDEFAGRYPVQLSGGQQQRVALARAIVNKPSVLLLDEPLAALDLQLRKRMQLELKSLQRHLGMTFIFVTHDQDEALTMSDKIVVMNGGCIEQIGSGEDIYSRPTTRFVAGFIGEANFIDLPAETIHGVAPAVRKSSSAQLMIRPEDIEVSLTRPSADAVQYVRGELVQKIFKGPFVSCICRSALGTGIIATPRAGAPDISPGDQVYLSWGAGASRLFDI